jgi:hypothetical protein
MTMPGSTPPWFIERFQLPSGAAMSGGKMYFFVAGSTTVPKNVFSDYALTIPLTQPLVMDAAGSAPQYFMEAGLYKVLIKDAANILQHTRDNIEGAAGSGSGLPGMNSASAFIENFPFPEGEWITDSASELWAQSPNLSFVNFFNVNGFTKLYWFEQFIPEGTGHQNANCAFWKTLGNFTSFQKIYDGGIVDWTYPGRFVFPTPLDITDTQILAFASDGGLGGGNSASNFVKQSKMSAGDGATGAPLNMSYLGIHAGGANTPFQSNSLPVCPDPNDPRYYMQMYVRIGVG